MSNTATKPTIAVPATIELDEQYITDILTNGIEMGGLGYWLKVIEVVLPEGVEREDFRIGGRLNNDDGLTGAPLARQIMYPGVVVKCEDSEDPDNEFTLTREKIIEGLALLAKGEYANGEKMGTRRHWTNIVGENDDVETADVVLQMAAFGNIVYG